MASEQIENLLDSLANANGVLGVVLCTYGGLPIRDTFPDLDRTQAIQYATMAATLARDAKEVAELQNAGGLVSLRVRTRNIELHVKASAEYLLVVIQDPQPAV
jgi:predicted regulator of Ras-like GTPase activity (Roadblock/LC7/MglB family)